LFDQRRQHDLDRGRRLGRNGEVEMGGLITRSAYPYRRRARIDRDGDAPNGGRYWTPVARNDRALRWRCCRTNQDVAQARFYAGGARARDFVAIGVSAARGNRRRLLESGPRARGTS